MCYNYLQGCDSMFKPVKILDEKDKHLRMISLDATFPISNEERKLIDNIIKQTDDTIILFSLLLHSLRSINSLPVDGYASHISLTSNHLTALRQGLAHDFLQGSTTTLHRINQIG